MSNLLKVNLLEMSGEEVKASLPDGFVLKLSRNKTTLGPILRKPRNRKPHDLSNSSNFARIVTGGSLDHSKDQKSESPKTESLKTLILQDSADVEAAITGIVALNYWDKIQVPSESEVLQQKRLLYYQKRNEVYEYLGFNPNTITKDNRPELAPDQLNYYNTELGKYSVTMWEYHLAFHTPGDKKWIRSKTFRSLTPITIDSLVKRINGWIKDDPDKVITRISIPTGPVTPSDINRDPNISTEV